MAVAMSSGTGAGYTGGCLCGAVRYRVSAEPLLTQVCWCRDCQDLGAGSGTINVVFPKSAVGVRGARSDYRSFAASGSVMRSRFCPLCRTPVLSESDARPHLTFARAGASGRL